MLNIVNDGKGKPHSFEVWDDDVRIQNIYGYGSNKEEAIEDYINNLKDLLQYCEEILKSKL